MINFFRHVFQVDIIITLLPNSSKDDLAQFSSTKFVGEYQLQLDGEQELISHTERTLKVGYKCYADIFNYLIFQVRNKHTTRQINQLVYSDWPDAGPPAKTSFMAFVTKAFTLRHLLKPTSKVLVYSR